MIEKLKQMSYQSSDLFDNKRVAVLITAFDRPEMYCQTIESMNKSDELENIPIFIYLDGGNRSKQKEHIEISRNLKFKNKYVITRSVNYGCEKNVLSAFNDLFLELNFDYVMYVEDDNVFGKNYFKYLYDSYNKIKREIDPNIGIFQGYTFCLLDKQEKVNLINNFRDAGAASHWGFMTSRDAFLKIRQGLSKYFDIVNSLPTNGTASIALHNQKKEIADIFDELIDNSQYEIPEDIKKSYYRKQNEHFVTGYDGAFLLSEYCLGIKRYMPLVNRMINIGKYGIHFNENLYKHFNLDKMTLDEVW